MFKVITQYKATGKRGGYVLQWIGGSVPSYITGPNATCGWYKSKADAVSRCEALNRSA
jgi:hypothetical protein